MARTNLRPTALCLAVLVFAVLPFSCSPFYTYEPPRETSDGWKTASLKQAGLDLQPLRDLVRRIHREKYRNIHAILVAKDGRVVFEEYFPGYRFDPEGNQFHGAFTEFHADETHNLASVTKLITATAVGAAIQRGDLADLDRPVLDFFPESRQLKDERRGRITIRHLLTMTSGLEWNEMDISIATVSGDHDLIRLWRAPDPIEFILAKPAVREPGSEWYYSGGDVNLLGETLKKATGMTLDAYAGKFLFEPMGIAKSKWLFLKDQVVYASGDLQLRPRDMLKFGQLYLDGGVWNGRRILSEEWVAQATTAQAPITRDDWRKAQGDHYGYHWFLRTYRPQSGPVPCYLRTGWGGQKLAVFPSLGMVVALTGGNYTTPDPGHEIIERYILKAAASP